MQQQHQVALDKGERTSSPIGSRSCFTFGAPGAGGLGGVFAFSTAALRRFSAASFLRLRPFCEWAGS